MNAQTTRLRQLHPTVLAVTAALSRPPHGAKRTRRAAVALATIVCLLVSTLLVATPTGPAAAAPTIVNDVGTKTVTMTGSAYEMKFSYSNRALITSYKQSGVEMLGTSGVFSAVNNNGTWVTTQSLATSPTVNVSGSVVTATFATSVASETWTFTATDPNITLNRPDFRSYWEPWPAGAGLADSRSA